MDLDLPKAAKTAVDEASTQIVPELTPLADAVVDRLLAGLKTLLVGRVITIVIK